MSNPTAADYERDLKNLIKGSKIGIPFLGLLGSGVETIIAASDALQGEEASDNLTEAAQIGAVTLGAVGAIVVLDKIFDKIFERIEARQQR